MYLRFHFCFHRPLFLPRHRITPTHTHTHQSPWVNTVHSLQLCRSKSVFVSCMLYDRYIRLPFISNCGRNQAIFCRVSRHCALRIQCMHIIAQNYIIPMRFGLCYLATNEVLFIFGRVLFIPHYCSKARKIVQQIYNNIYILLLTHRNW